MSGLAGQEDPFFKNMKVLYGKKGFRGFIEENAALLNKAIPPEDIKWASKRYKKVAGPIMRSPILNKIPIIGLTVGLYPIFASHMLFVPYAIGMFSVGICVKKMITEGREKYNKEVFYARVRVGEDLGILKKGNPQWTAKDLYDFDYGENNNESTGEK